ncbi:MAG: DMT family transporter [Alphaproteobacteria bacterium]|nr:DMT family transporter [Alphaproteobacteria bacterium]
MKSPETGAFWKRPPKPGLDMHLKDDAVLTGIGLMLFACFCSAGGSALAKGLMAGFPIAMVLFFRTITAWSLVFSFTRMEDFRGLPHPWLQLLRIVLCGVEVPIYFFALTELPIVDALTYYLATPIYVTAISALLGEHVGWRRWTAILVGFAGVLVALRPSAAMLTIPALVALTGSILYAGVLTTTRILRGTPDRILLIGQQTGVLIVAGAAVASQSWGSVTASDVVLSMLLGGLTLVGSFCINRSLKLAPASIVVPYQYTLLPWGGLFGFLFFAETPQVTTLLGAALIIGAGLYIFMREQMLAKRASMPVERLQ